MYLGSIEAINRAIRKSNLKHKNIYWELGYE